VQICLQHTTGGIWFAIVLIMADESTDTCCVYQLAVEVTKDRSVYVIVHQVSKCLLLEAYELFVHMCGIGSARCFSIALPEVCINEP
jgi:hypothetical protein